MVALASRVRPYLDSYFEGATRGDRLIAYLWFGGATIVVATGNFTAAIAILALLVSRSEIHELRVAAGGRNDATLLMENEQLHALLADASATLCGYSGLKHGRAAEECLHRISAGEPRDPFEQG